LARRRAWRRSWADWKCESVLQFVGVLFLTKVVNDLVASDTERGTEGEVSRTRKKGLRRGDLARLGGSISLSDLKASTKTSADKYESEDATVKGSVLLKPSRHSHTSCTLRGTKTSASEAKSPPETEGFGDN
jgi:hypothetical protein